MLIGDITHSGTDWYQGEYGIEVEIEGEDLSRYIPHWSTTYDGSLVPCPDAVEYMLHTPLDYEEVEMALIQLAEDQSEETVWKPSNRCGVHVHRNVLWFTPEEMLNLCTMYLIFEPLLLNYCGDHRVNNIFCLSGRVANPIIAKLIQWKKKGIRPVDRDQFKYGSLNIESVFVHGTVEFRSLPTPQDPRDIMKWVQILRCLEEHNPINILERISADGAEAVVRSVFGERAEDLLCDNVTQLLIASCRHVQPLVYARPKTIPSNPRDRRRNRTNYLPAIRLYTPREENYHDCLD